MDQVRKLAMEQAIQLLTGRTDDVAILLEAAREIEVYLRGQDIKVPPLTKAA
jgi:hypothetical protein